MRRSTSDSLTKIEHSVQDPNSPSTQLDLVALNWDHIREFRVLAAAGTLRAASKELGVSTNTVRARLARLEAQVARTLMRRSPKGIRLTDAGRQLIETSQAMADAAAASYRPEAEAVLVRSGRLTIGCSEGLGNLWLTPRVTSLTALLPNLSINLSFDYNLARDRAQECDVWLTFERPTEPDVVVSKLATVHFLPFASRSYIKRFGAPANADELKRHRIVEHEAPGVKSDLLDYLVGSDRPTGMITLSSNSSLAQLRAVVDGVGIGGLPTFVCELTRTLQPVAPNLSIRRELWLAYRLEAKKSIAIQDAVAWLREAFDAREHPCFADVFVHPSAMTRHTRRDTIFRLGDRP